MERHLGRDELDIPAPTYRVPAKRRILDMDTRRLALVAGFFACGLALVVSVWTAMSGSRGGPVPLVTADPRPLKVKPENPGGMQMAGQNEDILGSSSANRGVAGQLAPAPEAPAPQALRARQQAEEAARQAAAAHAAQAAANAPLPQPVSLAPAASVPPAIPAPSIVAASPPARPAPNGKALVQLAAVGTEQAAKAEWQRLSKRMPDVLNGRQPVVVKLERDGKTFWRLRTGGFADSAQATAFCDRVKAKGAACSVAIF